MSRTDREYDKTHLSIDTAEERILVHRDYIAHCLRWSHVIKHLYKSGRYHNARILDVGCGREAPLAKLLYSNRMTGARYTGIDMNKLEMPEMLAKAVLNGKLSVQLLGETDASKVRVDDLAVGYPNIITCFEVFEHVHPRIARDMLLNLRMLVKEDAFMFFSTPCWNGSAAANHVNETTYDAMAAVLHECGWEVRAVYGTFASQTDYKDKLNVCEAHVFARLQEYYDSNLLAVMLAPLFPHLSRNALWVCAPGEALRGLLDKAQKPWSQHADWEQLAQEGEDEHLPRSH